MATKKGEIYLRPSEIRYSQISILNKFKNGYKLGDLLDDMYFGRCFASAIDRIEVAKVDGLWYSADNRRLWVFKHLEMLDRLDRILVKVKKKIFHGKLTTTNKGMSVKVRGGDPGGSVYTELRKWIQTQENISPENKENETPKKRKRRRRGKKKAKNENRLKETNVTDTMKIERQQLAETKSEHVYAKEEQGSSEGWDNKSDQYEESDLETDDYTAGYIEPVYDEDWFLENEYSEDEGPETDDSEELSQESDNYDEENTESCSTDDEFQNTDPVQQQAGTSFSHCTSDKQVTTDKHSELWDFESDRAYMTCTLTKLDDFIKALTIQNEQIRSQVIEHTAQNNDSIRRKVPSGINFTNQTTFGDHIRSQTVSSERFSSPRTSSNPNTSHVTVDELHRRQSRTSEPFTSHSVFGEHTRRQFASNEPMTSHAALGERIKRQVPYSEHKTSHAAFDESVIRQMPYSQPRTSHVTFDESVRRQVPYSQPRTSHVTFDESVRRQMPYSQPRTSHVVFDESVRRQVPYNEYRTNPVTYDERTRRQMANNESTSHLTVGERAIKQTAHGEPISNAGERSWPPILAKQTLWNDHGKLHRTSNENNKLSKTSREGRSMRGSLNDELDNYSGNTTFSYGNNYRYYQRARDLDNNEPISTVYKDTPETSLRKTVERDNVFKPDPSARLATPKSKESFLGKVFDKVLDFFWPSSK